MEQFVKLLEQAGFSVTNANDYENIEIRDLRNNNELLKKNMVDDLIYFFSSSSDRSIVVSNKSISINCGNGLVINQVSINDNVCSYQIENRLNDGKKNIVECRCFEHGKDFIGGISVKVEHESIKDNKFEKHGQLNMGLGMLQCTIVFDGDIDNAKSCDVENCNSELFVNTIVSFLNNTELTTNNPKLQEGFKIILPLIRDQINNIFTVHRENLQSYIQQLENSKVIATEEYQAKIASINNSIERLKILSQPQNKTK